MTIRSLAIPAMCRARFPGTARIAILSRTLVGGADGSNRSFASQGCPGWAEANESALQDWGEVLGISEEEVIDRLQALEREGVVRRFAATIGHRALGIVANAMIAWIVPPERVEGQESSLPRRRRSPTAMRGRRPPTGLTTFIPWSTPEAGKTA